MAKNSNDNTPANVDEKTGEVTQARAAIRFREWLGTQAELDQSDPWEVTARQLDKMLMATSFEDIMDADETGTHETRDLVGFEFEIPQQQIRIAKTAPQFDAPLGVYIQFVGLALADFPEEYIKTGDEVLMSSGAPLIIGKLRTLQANGFLPVKVTIKGTTTPNGTVLKLRPAPVRAVPSDATA